MTVKHYFDAHSESSFARFANIVPTVVGFEDWEGIAAQRAAILFPRPELLSQFASGWGASRVA
jgi:hypothetical protein